MASVSALPRIKLQNILFATDLTASAQAALSYALDVARRYNATLFNLHVLPHMPFVEATTPDPEEARELARQQLAAQASSEAFKGIKHKEWIEEGEVPGVVADMVREHEIDLIVIGTCGREGFGKLLLGSVAEEIFRTSQCPVLTVGPHAIHWPANRNLRQILYATDFGPASVQALPYALTLAEEHQAQLIVLHVAPEPGTWLAEPQPGSEPFVDTAQIVDVVEKQLRDFIPKDTQLRQEPKFLVQFGSAPDAIVKVAMENCDMIVMGAKRPGTFTKHLGAGVAYKVACTAPCPVFSVSKANV